MMTNSAEITDIVKTIFTNIYEKKLLAELRSLSIIIPGCLTLSDRDITVK